MTQPDLLQSIRAHLADLAKGSPHDYGMDKALGIEGLSDEQRVAKVTEDFAAWVVGEFVADRAPRGRRGFVWRG